MVSCAVERDIDQEVPCAHRGITDVEVKALIAKVAHICLIGVESQ